MTGRQIVMLMDGILKRYNLSFEDVTPQIPFLKYRVGGVFHEKLPVLKAYKFDDVGLFVMESEDEAWMHVVQPFTLRLKMYVLQRNDWREEKIIVNTYKANIDGVIRAILCAITWAYVCKQIFQSSYIEVEPYFVTKGKVRMAARNAYIEVEGNTERYYLVRDGKFVPRQEFNPERWKFQWFWERGLTP